MLSRFPVVPTLAVSDLAAAKQFYESVLNFSPGDNNEEGQYYSAGNCQFFIYRSQFAGTNKATAMSFQLPKSEFDSEVEALRSAGVTFESFDAPGVTWTDGVADFAGQRAVWFKDPDGNFLNLESTGD